MVALEGSLAAYFWQFEPREDSVAKPQTASMSEISVALSKDLKKRGWKFVGPTTVYAFMQAMGLINDHAEGCFMRPVIDAARREFERP
jgi:DNA-3-methyladenine glycosylase I